MAEMLCRPVEVHVIKGNETFKILLAVKPQREEEEKKVMNGGCTVTRGQTTK